MKILLSGGWTLGGVTPLIALKEHMEAGNSFVWVGTQAGPERPVVEAAGIPFTPIFSGKIRRYFSVDNFLDLFRIAVGIVQSVLILLKEKPDVHVTAGGFVSLPPAIAGWFLGVPLVVHQEDLEPLRANRFMSRMAAAVTVTVPEAGKAFARFHPVVVGNPVRQALRQAPNEPANVVLIARTKLGLEHPKPTLVVFGGGTGSLPVNERLVAALPELLPHMQVYHVTGKNKHVGAPPPAGPDQVLPGYHQVEFVTTGMEDLYLAADVVLCRAGFGTLTELAVFRKAAVLIPLPRSAQIQNAQFALSHNAAEMLQEPAATPTLLARVILHLMADPAQREQMGNNLHQLFGDGDPQPLAAVVERVAKRTPSTE